MIENIKSEAVEIGNESILMSQIKTSLYSDPLLFSVNLSLSMNPWKEGDEISISLLNKEVVKAYYMLTRTNSIHGQRSTTFVFSNEEHVKIRYNRYPKNVSLFGVKMERIIKNSNIQEILDFEMRKKGVVFSHEGYELKHIPIDECFNGESQVIMDITSVKVIDKEPTRHNYSSTIEGEDIYITDKGFDYPRFIPFLSKQEVRGLNKFITPKLLITSSSLNLDIDIATTVVFYNNIYTITNKVITTIGNEYLVTLELGLIIR